MTKGSKIIIGSMVAISLLLGGCASNGFLMAQPEITMIGEASAAKASTKEIDVYYTKRPDRKYEEVAMISVGDTDDDWSMEQIKKSARELGADAVIITGRVGSYGYYANNTGIGVGEGYGLSAVAIRYK